MIHGYGNGSGVRQMLFEHGPDRGDTSRSTRDDNRGDKTKRKNRTASVVNTRTKSAPPTTTITTSSGAKETKAAVIAARRLKGGLARRAKILDDESRNRAVLG